MYESIIRISRMPFIKQTLKRISFQNMHLFVKYHACWFNSIITAIYLVNKYLFSMSTILKNCHRMNGNKISKRVDN